MPRCPIKQADLPYKSQRKQTNTSTYKHIHASYRPLTKSNPSSKPIYPHPPQCGPSPIRTLQSPPRSPKSINCDPQNQPDSIIFPTNEHKTIHPQHFPLKNGSPYNTCAKKLLKKEGRWRGWFTWSERRPGDGKQDRSGSVPGEFRVRVWPEAMTEKMRGRRSNLGQKIRRK